MESICYEMVITLEVFALAMLLLQAEGGFLKTNTKCDIFYYTGPDMFTHAYHTYPKKERLYIHYENNYKSKLDYGKKGDYGL